MKKITLISDIMSQIDHIQLKITNKVICIGRVLSPLEVGMNLHTMYEYVDTYIHSSISKIST